MKCSACGAGMTTTREDYRFTESGLSNVMLRNVEIRRCPRCGEEEVVIEALDAVHRKIAQDLVAKPGRLAPEEIRFLRKHVDLSGTALAAHMGVAAETVSRWENGAQDMGPVADRLLRMIAASQDLPQVAYRLETLQEVATGGAEPLHVEISPQALTVLSLGKGITLGTEMNLGARFTLSTGINLGTGTTLTGITLDTTGLNAQRAIAVDLGITLGAGFTAAAGLNLGTGISIGPVQLRFTDELPAFAANDNLALAA